MSADGIRPAVSASEGFGSGALSVAAVQEMDPFALVDAIRSLSMADVEDLGEREAEGLVAVCERAVTAIQARGSLAMDTLAHRVQQPLDDEAEEFAAATGASRIRWMSSSHQLVPSMLAPALRVASRTVLARLEADGYLVNTMGTTFEAMWSGDLERHRADAVTECGRGLSGKALERYEDLVLESSVDKDTGEVVTMSERVKDLPRATLRRHAAKIARDVDPKVTQAWAQDARESRHVRVRGAADPGMTQWHALLPGDVSQRVWAAVDALAASYCRASSGLKSTLPAPMRWPTWCSATAPSPRRWSWWSLWCH